MTPEARDRTPADKIDASLPDVGGDPFAITSVGCNDPQRPEIRTLLHQIAKIALHNLLALDVRGTKGPWFAYAAALQPYPTLRGKLAVDLLLIHQPISIKKLQVEASK